MILTKLIVYTLLTHLFNCAKNGCVLVPSLVRVCFPPFFTHLRGDADCVRRELRTRLPTAHLAATCLALIVAYRLPFVESSLLSTDIHHLIFHFLSLSLYSPLRLH